jgi:hypothetical protein
LEREQALIVAEAQIILKRVRRARTQIMHQMLPAPATEYPDADGSADITAVTRSAVCLDQLLPLDRPALARRKRAVRFL